MANDKLKVKFGYNISLQKFSPEIISYQSDSTSFVLNKDIFTNNFIWGMHLSHTKIINKLGVYEYPEKSNGI
jgi:hypothetical protein